MHVIILLQHILVWSLQKACGLVSTQTCCLSSINVCSCVTTPSLLRPDFRFAVILTRWISSYMFFLLLLLFFFGGGVSEGGAKLKRINWAPIFVKHPGAERICSPQRSQTTRRRKTRINSTPTTDVPDAFIGWVQIVFIKLFIILDLNNVFFYHLLSCGNEKVKNLLERPSW